MIDGVDQIDLPGGKSGEIKPEVVTKQHSSMKQHSSI